MASILISGPQTRSVHVGAARPVLKMKTYIHMIKTVITRQAKNVITVRTLLQVHLSHICPTMIIMATGLCIPEKEWWHRVRG